MTDKSKKLYLRIMMRCTACRRWWSVAPEDSHDPRCACGAALAPVDMKSHILSLPQGAKTHNHVTKERKPPGECEACDLEYLKDRAVRDRLNEQSKPKP